jgi:nucleotide-binding universal stress UspA family protein
MTEKRTRSQIAAEVAEIAGAARRVSTPVERAIDDMDDVTRPGAREVATLTVAARSLDWQFEPVMKALESASKITDWSHPFMVAHQMRGHMGPSFNWRDAPYRFYKSFEHFYESELEQTFGSWESLQHTWQRVVKGKITEKQAREEIEEERQAARAAKANEIDAATPDLTKHGGDHKSDAYQDRAEKNDPTLIKRGNDYDIARLRRDRPDIHARVLAGEISAHAGMIEAGFRKRAQSRKRTPFERACKLLDKLSADERRELRDRIDSTLRRDAAA